MRSKKFSAILVTATDRERKTLLAELRDQNIDAPLFEEGGRYYNRFTIASESKPPSIDCLVAQPTDKGPLPTQSLVHALNDSFSPEVILLVGVAGGVDERGVGLGDVIVAQNVFNYERAKITEDGYLARPQPYPCSPRVLNLVRALKANNLLDGALAGKRLHIKDYASGEKVLMDKSSELRKVIIGFSEDIYGFEMEGQGLLHALFELSENKVIRGGVVKCVSDLGDPEMGVDKEAKQQEAARRASRVVLQMLRYF